jgi:hypothetical protein
MTVDEPPPGGEPPSGLAVVHKYGPIVQILLVDDEPADHAGASIHRWIGAKS